jgi:hypothetical protein
MLATLCRAIGAACLLSLLSCASVHSGPGTPQSSQANRSAVVPVNDIGGGGGGGGGSGY